MARDVWSILLPLVVVTILTSVTGWFWQIWVLKATGGCLLILVGFVLFFFRDPDRETPSAPGLVVAAGDGRVVDVQPVDQHEWLGDGGTRVSVFLSIFSVHVNRLPVNGTVTAVRHVPGRFRLAFKDKASDDNEHTEIWIDTGSTRVAFKQIAGFVARRIVCRLKEGDRAQIGERFGMIKFGSRVDHLLPTGSEVKVKPGDRVRAGETVIGVIPT
jgi:phosphatidylserine decarboxylase